MTTITVRGIEKRFGNEVALRGCDLDFRDHEFLVLVGPSGSGKTTLLRIIAGLEEPTSGDLYFGDKLVNDVDVGDRDIAMVFQNYGLYPHMNVYSNMAFGLRKRHLPRAEIDQRVRDTAGLLGIEPMLKRKPKQLSGGQRQRVALGRAIVRDPAVFLLDEPLSNLDAHLRVAMRGEILKVHRAVSATAVYVTHDQVEALTMGDRIAVMNDGQIQQVGPPEELYDHPVNRFVAGFIGTPAMGFLTVSKTGTGAILQGNGVRLTLPPQRAAELSTGVDEVVVGLRAEHLRPVTETERADQASVIDGIVSLVEPLGSELQVAVDVGGQLITARLSRRQPVCVDEKLAFAVDTDNLHLFDPQTGATYGAAIPAGASNAAATVLS
jgi:multiple sugar transport system ATP-binding protein